MTLQEPSDKLMSNQKPCVNTSSEEIATDKKAEIILVERS